jgi:hypothetical protein
MNSATVKHGHTPLLREENHNEKQQMLLLQTGGATVKIGVSHQ